MQFHTGQIIQFKVSNRVAHVEGTVAPYRGFGSRVMLQFLDGERERSEEPESEVAPLVKVIGQMPPVPFHVPEYPELEDDELPQVTPKEKWYLGPLSDEQHWECEEPRTLEELKNTPDGVIDYLMDSGKLRAIFGE